jgi:hypothetical protein
LLNPRPQLQTKEKNMAIEYPDLTPDFCLHAAISAAPHPNWYKPDDDPSVKVLFDLGVATATDSAIYAQAVKANIFPWRIDSAAVAAAPNTLLETAADSIQAGAFKEQAND